MAGSNAPDFSIVIPVLHEVGTINGLLEHIRSLDGAERCEIIIVDGDPEGETIRTIAGKDAVKIVSSTGRSRQMNAGAAVARGEVIVFLHADTFLPGTAFSDIDGALAKERCEAGAFRLRFDSRRWIYRVMSAFVSLRTSWNRLPYGDQAIFIRRRFFEEIGGYKPIPLMEDVELMRRIRNSGRPIAMVNACVTTSCRRMQAEGILRRILLNWMITVLYNMGVPPERLTRFYTEDHRLKTV